MSTGAARSARWAARWRSARPRLVDLLLSTAVLLVALLAAAFRLVSDTQNEVLGPATWVSATLTAVLGVALWWRRRAPLLLVVAACAVVAAGASQVLLSITLATLAVRRRDRVLVAVVAGAVLAQAVGRWYLVPPGTPAARITDEVFFATLFIGLPVTSGAFVGARRELVASLRERAERAEAEQLLRAEQARTTERTRIAREMHDVLGHRISLVALHAGGLEVSTTSPETARSAALIAAVAREALADLRGVLGVLLADAHVPVDAASASEARALALRPQPTLDDVAALVRASARAGVRVDLAQHVPTDPPVPALIGRTAYRVVQEALTNVHKHAPDAATTVRLTGARGEDLLVEVLNARSAAVTGAPEPEGSGLGLIGLRERVHLVHGRLEAGPAGDGGFAVRARLPWTEPQEDLRG